MSKQSKKQKRRRDRQKKRRRRNLIILFKDLYPHAPEGTAEQIIDQALSGDYKHLQANLSSTELVKQATMAYLRHNLTTYNQLVDDYIEAFLQGIERGEPFMGKTPQQIEHEANLEAETLIKKWQIGEG
jgi:hypothetical protein